VRVDGADAREPRPLGGLPRELDDDPTRRKQPTRIDAQTPALPPWQPPQARAYPQAGGPEQPGPLPPPPQRPGPRPRRPWYVAGGVVAAAAVVGVIVALSSGGGKHQARDVTPTDDTQIVLPTGPQVQAPGTPQVTGARQPNGKIKFRWTYDA